MCYILCVCSIGALAMKQVVVSNRPKTEAELRHDLEFYIGKPRRGGRISELRKHFKMNLLRSTQDLQ